MIDPRTDLSENAVFDATKPALEAALEEMKRLNEQLHNMLATIPTLVWKANSDGSAEFFNQRWYDYTGVSPENAQGRGWMSAFHPDDLEMLSARWREIVASERPSEVEARIRRHDGVYRWHIMRSEPLFDDHGRLTGWCGTNTDIEDFKQAEGELRRSKVFLEHAQRLSHTGGVGLRLPGGELFWSEETARIYDYPLDVPPTREMVLERVHPDDIELLAQVFGRAMEGGASLDFEHRLQMPDGSVKYIRCLANSVIDAEGCEEVLGAIMDITEQHHAEAALTEALVRIKQSEDKLRTIIDTIPTLAWSSPNDGMADFLSKRWLDYTGLTHEEARGAGWFVAIHPDDVRGLADTWKTIRESGREGGTEARLKRFDGIYRWFLFRAAPIKEPGRETVWYGTNTDIEDLKQAEAELRRRESDLRKAQAELAHVTRVTTLGELTASIAHEVSQPIAGIVINSNTCARWLSQLQESQATKGAQQALQRIIRDGTRAGDVITRIRALFKKKDLAKEPLEINDLIQEVVTLSRSEIEKRRVNLRLELAPNLPRVLGDRVQLQQVVINLVLNAVEAMSEIGHRRELFVETHFNEGSGVVATVRDTGVGFASADIETLFTAFQTTKPGGLGMGLSISRSIVENHGGQLWATKNVDNGATFHFNVPLILRPHESETSL